ncbi:MAG: hypothetical protein R3E01_33115 [Pirellulaceae bacterium]
MGVEDYLHPFREAFEALASQYAFDSDKEADHESLDLLWYLLDQATFLITGSLKDSGDAQVDDAFIQLGKIWEGDHSRSDGFQYTRSLPFEGRYVVFSDHHIYPTGHRQGYLETNLNLYGRILDNYYESEFTLIENGDVFELIIPDPDSLDLDSLRSLVSSFRQSLSQYNADALAELRQAQMQGQLPPTNAALEWYYDYYGEVDEFWKQNVTEWRLNQRLKHFERIIDSHDANLFRKIRESFVEDHRYVLLRGNHDVDLQEPRFASRLDQLYPGIFAQDIVCIRDTNNSAGYMIAHGHQFDRGTSPAMATYKGETFSESLSWAIEGPDRYWPWSECHKWTTPASPFRNRLSSAEPNEIKLAPADLIGALLVALSGGSPYALVVGGVISELYGNALRSLLHNGVLLELLFEHEIAWDYFEHSDAVSAVLEEVLPGKRWFKVRHMNELRIAKGLKDVFGEGPLPSLVLGHSHEVRQNALNSGGNAIPYYFNCGAAGRFENLVWALEIVDGEPKLVSWHSDGGPGRGNPVRLEYSDDGAGGLVTSGVPSPLSRLDRHLAVRLLAFDSLSGRL